MIKKIHDIYPSSNVSPEVISEYGWTLIEELPASVFKPNGDLARRVAPTAEASEYLRELRGVIDEIDTLQLGTEQGVIEIEDFAVTRIDTATESQLGFFVLPPRQP